MGRGLVHPTDFHYAENPPVNPELLALLTEDLVANRFDLHYLVRQIVLSKTYQRSCEPPAAETLNLADIGSRLEALTQKRQQLNVSVDQLQRSDFVTHTLGRLEDGEQLAKAETEPDGEGAKPGEPPAVEGRHSPWYPERQARERLPRVVDHPRFVVQPSR
jgi:hypothetical protein